MPTSLHIPTSCTHYRYAEYFVGLHLIDMEIGGQARQDKLHLQRPSTPNLVVAEHGPGGICLHDSGDCPGALCRPTEPLHNEDWERGQLGGKVAAGR